jgi:hypothetical protein
VTLDELRIELMYPLDAPPTAFSAGVNSHRRPTDGQRMPPASVPGVLKASLEASAILDRYVGRPKIGNKAGSGKPVMAETAPSAMVRAMSPYGAGAPVWSGR